MCENVFKCFKFGQKRTKTNIKYFIGKRFCICDKIRFLHVIDNVLRVPTQKQNQFVVVVVVFSVVVVVFKC